MDGETIEIHLENLDLDQSEFLNCFNRVKTPFAN